MTIPFHQEQLEFMTGLAANRPEWLNPFFRFLAYFDSPYFFFVLIPFIWIGFSYTWGIRIFYWFMLSNLINSLVKYLVGWPRPSTDLPEIGMFHPTSYGFPSGGAQTCMFLGAILIYYWRTPAAWIIGSTYILLISFSRLYLGVHYPIDILGGWTIALILFALFVLTKTPLESFLKKRGLLFSLILGVVVPLTILLVVNKKEISYIMGSIIGITVGTCISLKYDLFLKAPANLLEGIGRGLIAILVTFLAVLLISGYFAKSLFISLFMSTAVSPICLWLSKQKQM